MDKYIIEGEKDDEFLQKIPKMTIGKYLWTILNQYDPNKLAEIDEIKNEKVTYKQLIDHGKSLSKLFCEFGCGIDDLVVVCCGNELAFSSSLLGCLWNGCPCAPIYNNFPSDDYEAILKKYDPKVIIANEEIYPRLKDVYNKIQNVIKNSPKFILILKNENNIKNYANCLSYSDCITKYVIENNKFKPFEIPENELKNHCCVILPTSGSTGPPKGARHSDTSIMYGLFFWMNTIEDNLTKCIISLTGGYWLSGLFTRWCAFNKGVLNVLLLFETELFLKCVDKYQANVALITPGYFGALMKSDWTPYDTSSLKLILYGGGKISDELIQLSYEKTKCKKLNIYGMTEIMVVHNPLKNMKSNGKLYPGVKAKVISIDNGNNLPPNEVGELCLKALTVILGYQNNPEATADLFDSEGWLHTGDMVYYTEDGQFFVVDRIKELIKYKSLHVNSSDIEGFINKLDGVFEVCVVGIPHPLDWEHARAFVVRKPNIPITENQIIEFIKENLPDYKWLYGGVQFVDALPKTISGKYMRREIKAMYRPDKK